MAHSGGSILGALAVARHPGCIGPTSAWARPLTCPETDRIFYADVLSWARANGNRALERTLVDRGPAAVPRLLLL